MRLLDWCDEIGAKAIPYGGGSSVVKGIEPPPAADKVVTISTRHMDKVLEVDPVSQAARIQGGIYGPAIEDQLRDTPFTMRHYMQAYRCSTLGGWIATRSGGHYATLYTHIDDFVESTRMVTPAGMHGDATSAGLRRRAEPRPHGPRLRRHPRHHHRSLGAAAPQADASAPRPRCASRASTTAPTRCAAITQAGLYPANCRLLEAREALPGMPWSSTRGGAGARLRIGRPSARRLDGAGAGDLPRPRRRRRSRRPTTRTPTAPGAAGAWRNRFIRAPHYGEHAVARGILSSTFETSMTWERFRDFHQKITRITQDTIKRVTGRDGTVTCRFTHVYPDGPCLYFTFGGILDKRMALEQFMEVLSTCTAATVEHGGTTTHHHAVGRFHRPFYDRQRPELFARALRGAKRELDPKGMMNPGVLIDP